MEKMAEKNEDTVKVPEGEIVQILESELVGEG